MTHDDVVVPVDLAELRLALVVVVTVGSERQLHVTLPVGRVGRLLLADERLAALRVALADQTAVDALNTPTRLQTDMDQPLKIRNAILLLILKQKMINEMYLNFVQDEGLEMDSEYVIILYPRIDLNCDDSTNS